MCVPKDDHALFTAVDISAIVPKLRNKKKITTFLDKEPDVNNLITHVTNKFTKACYQKTFASPDEAIKFTNSIIRSAVAFGFYASHELHNKRHSQYLELLMGDSSAEVEDTIE